LSGPGISAFCSASRQAPPESILQVQDLDDNHYDGSSAWRQVLAAVISPDDPLDQHSASGPGSPGVYLPARTSPVS